MILDENELDRIVYEIVPASTSVQFTREDIIQFVQNDISARIAPYVLPSLERLVAKGRIIEERDDTRGRPYIYWKPPFDRRI